MRCAIYARVSTTDQTCDNQLLEIRRYVEARGWTIQAEHIDHGVSGATDRRPALDQMIADAKTVVETCSLYFAHWHARARQS